MQKRQLVSINSEIIARFRRFTIKNIGIGQSPAEEPPGNSGPEKPRGCGRFVDLHDWIEAGTGIRPHGCRRPFSPYNAHTLHQVAVSPVIYLFGMTQVFEFAD